MLKIYELEKELSDVMQILEEWAVEHEGDISDFPLEAELNKLQGDLERKALNIATAVVNLRAEADAYGDQVKKLTEARRSITNKADRLENFLTTLIEPGTKLHDTRVSIGWRKSERVKCQTEPILLPEEYVRLKEPEVRLDEIKKALKAGTAVEGCSLEQHFNIQIK